MYALPCFIHHSQRSLVNVVYLLEQITSKKYKHLSFWACNFLALTSDLYELISV